MSVRVNLLPEATKQRGRASQQRLLAIGGIALLILVLAGLYLLQANRLSGLEADLADAENSLAVALSEQADLAPFADFEGRVNAVEGQLSAAFRDEVSLAAVLQDLAAVTPADTGLTDLNLVVQQADELEEVEQVGVLNLQGQVTSGLAPGVEHVLLNFERVGTFGQPFFDSSTVNEDGVADFSLEVALLPNARTDRYSDGLPQEFRR